MKTADLDRYFRSILPIEDFAKSDVSLNGLQLGSSGDEVQKIAFAVDACMASFEQAAALKADMIFVHHGLYWGKPVPVTGVMYERLRFLLTNRISLYAAHLPLDMHPEIGNNAGIAAALELKDVQPFGTYRGSKIGYKGKLSEPCSIEEIKNTVVSGDSGTELVLPFGDEKISTVAIVSGGAASDVEEAIEEEIDCYITGEPSHQVYHTCLEAGINVIFGGHYKTETWGVKLLSEKCKNETGVETVFLDIPTGL
ncbi:MAG: Nif3-like dinuclear metal center hexameric protein [Spirochaetia bacterium]